MTLEVVLLIVITASVLTSAIIELLVLVLGRESANTEKWAPPNKELQKWPPFEDLPEVIGTSLIYNGYKTKQQVLDAPDQDFFDMGMVPGEVTRIREVLS